MPSHSRQRERSTGNCGGTPSEREVDRGLERQCSPSVKLGLELLCPERSIEPRQRPPLDRGIVVFGRGAETRRQLLDAPEETSCYARVADLRFAPGDAEHRPELHLD